MESHTIGGWSSIGTAFSLPKAWVALLWRHYIWQMLGWKWDGLLHFTVIAATGGVEVRNGLGSGTKSLHRSGQNSEGRNEGNKRFSVIWKDENPNSQLCVYVYVSASVLTNGPLPLCNQTSLVIYIFFFSFFFTGHKSSFRFETTALSCQYLHTQAHTCRHIFKPTRAICTRTFRTHAHFHTFTLYKSNFPSTLLPAWNKSTQAHWHTHARKHMQGNQYD